MRRHKDPSGRQPKQKTTQAQKTPTTPTVATTATSTGALHPLRDAAPVMWRCTRTEEVDCLRIGCSAPTHKNKRGTGTPNHSPPHPSMRTWALLAAGWARRPRHPRRHLHSGPLQHLPHPYMQRTRYPRRFRLLTARFHVWPCTIGPQQRQEPPENGRARARNGTQRRRHDPLGKDADEPHRSTEGYIHSQSRTPSVVATRHYRLMA